VGIRINAVRRQNNENKDNEVSQNICISPLIAVHSC
jgi:hypothetical protein